jgi:hypothetical protein
LFLRFALWDLKPRCALDADSGTEERLTKILHLIEDCPFGIHDLSYMKIDPRTKLPRHNMPFELGLFLGCEFSTRAFSKKNCLILDREAWRYRESVSDLSGRDIRVHKGRASHAIAAVRDWLVTASNRTDAPGADFFIAQYRRFRRQLPLLCATTKRNAAKLNFWDYRAMAKAWLENA